jgi:hypothetical protein
MVGNARATQRRRLELVGTQACVRVRADSDDTITIGVQLNNGSSLTTVPLCTIVGNATQFGCKAAGPVQIAKGDLYKLDLTGSGLEGNEQATFAYRLAVG